MKSDDDSTVSSLKPFNLYDRPEDIIPIGVAYTKDLPDLKVPGKGQVRYFKPTYIGRFTSDDFLKLNSSDITHRNTTHSNENDEKFSQGSGKNEKNPGLSKLVVRLNFNSSQSTSQPSKVIKVQINKSDISQNSSKKSSSEPTKSRNVTKAVTDSEDINLTSKTAKGDRGERKSFGGSNWQLAGCWTCRVRHKSCPQDGEICSTCTRLNLFCDRSPTRPDYMKNREYCKKMVRDIKEITSVARHKALQEGKKTRNGVKKRTQAKP